MFSSLSDRFDVIFSRLRSRGRLTEADVDEILREIRLALLQADVNIKVVRTFIARIKEKAIGAELSKSLTPGQQVIKIVHDELVAILGRRAAQGHLRLPAADGRAARRLAGLGQDHRGRETGPLVQAAGPQPAPRRRRPPAPGRGRAAPGARRPGGGPGLQRGVRPGDRRQGGPRGGPAPGQGRADRRHRGPLGHRRGADGGGPPDLRRRSSPTSRSSSSTP